MRVHDGFCDREADPVAAGRGIPRSVGAVETVKKVRELSRIDLRCRVETARTDMLELMKKFPDDQRSGFHAVQYIGSRIKSPESMMEKLKRKALPETLEAALCEVHDAVGIRVICSFADDVFRVEKWLKSQENYELVKEKDYISYPKPNGYRGIHLILRGMTGKTAGTYVEIQLRTIAMDFWASLEHKIYYKFEGNAPEYISRELKECAKMVSELDDKMLSLNEAILRCLDEAEEESRQLELLKDQYGNLIVNE